MGAVRKRHGEVCVVSSFADRAQTRKGAIGEGLVRQHLERKGLVVYTPLTDAAHPFDFLCASGDKRTIVIAETKTKARRTYYPDTGIDARHLNDYMIVQERYGIDVFLYFVDESIKAIYGNALKTLLEPREITHRNKPIKYPLAVGGIVYFPLNAMKTIAHISDAEALSIIALNTRNEAYPYPEAGAPA